MPSDDALDEMSQKICGFNFNQLSPDHRAVIMRLAILADMAIDTSQIGNWFDKSRLWEGA